MPYDRVNAFGVQRGQVSPAEIFQQQQAEAVRRAHMAALMGSGAPGSRSSGGLDTGGEVDIGAGPQAQKPSEMIGHGGLPYADIAAFDRQKNAGLEMQTLKGTQEMGLSKEMTNRSFGTADRQMAPANIDADQRVRQWNDLAGRRGIEDEKLRNENFLEGAKANVLRGMLTPEQGGTMATGPTGPDLFGNDPPQQPRDTAGAERMLMLLNGQNPDKQNIEVEGLRAQMEILKQQLGERQKSIPSAGIAEAYNQAKPMLEGDLARMKNFIRSNNWSIAGNKDQLRSLYNSMIMKASQMKLPPDVYRLYENDVKNTMRDALSENGMMFESAGSDAVRQEYGL